MSDQLNCPNCGAGISAGCSECPFCQTRLKTVVCPHCFKTMFAGSAFCDHCGGVAAPVMEATASTGDCPRCKSPMDALSTGGVAFENCGKCDGIWVDPAVFEVICADREKQSSVLAHLNTPRQAADAFTKVAYVPCPKCRQLMNRSNFARLSGVIIDVCKPHGVWCDADELPAIVKFITDGGMERARQRDKDELREERSPLSEAVIAADEEKSLLWTEPHRLGVRSLIEDLFDR